MKHIGIVVPNFPVLSETFVRTEIKALLDVGHRVTVFTFAKTNLSWSDTDIIEFTKLPDGIAFCSWLKTSQTLKENAKLVAQEQTSIGTFSLLREAAKLRFYVKRLNIEHLHCHFMQNSIAYGLVAAKLSGISVSAIGHGHDVYVAPYDLNVKLKHCDFIVAVCKSMASYFQTFNKERIRLLHCGVDIDFFQPRKRSYHERKKLLFVGRLVEQKGVQYALRALSDLPQSMRPTLDIIGDGPLENDLIELINVLALTDNVRLLGSRSSSEIALLAGDYDALIAPFCVSSKGEKDTGPLVLKEAMAMGLPVITCDVMGCSEIVTQDSGYLVESRNSIELGRAIFDFCHASDNRMQAMSSCARKRVETMFNAQNQALKLSTWIEKAHYEFN